jgi:toxin-antitoxin system PIN domain toxin
VILVDANLLLYAYYSRAEQHERSKAWLESVLSGASPVRFAWMTVLAFLRIGTSPRLFEEPLSMDEAASIVTSWLAQPAVEILEPGERYWSILVGLLRDAQVSGALVSDAALAALAIEHGSTLCTTDRDFTRFEGLQTSNPLAD